jgi:predicted RNA-binding Zn-ribbon protein involved in translation (DUF1610 family)
MSCRLTELKMLNLKEHACPDCGKMTTRRARCLRCKVLNDRKQDAEHRQYQKDRRARLKCSSQ